MYSHIVLAVKGYHSVKFKTESLFFTEHSINLIFPFPFQHETWQPKGSDLPVLGLDLAASGDQHVSDTREPGHLLSLSLRSDSSRLCLTGGASPGAPASRPEGGRDGRQSSGER